MTIAVFLNSLHFLRLTTEVADALEAKIGEEDIEAAIRWSKEDLSLNVKLFYSREKVNIIKHAKSCLWKHNDCKYSNV